MNSEMAYCFGTKMAVLIIGLAREGCTTDQAQRGPYKMTEGQYSPVRPSRSVSKLFVIWHRFFERSDTSSLGEFS